MSATYELHEPTIEVSMAGSRVKCSCGWSTHPTLKYSTSTKRAALDHWYIHFVGAQRAAQVAQEAAAADAQATLL